MQIEDVKDKEEAIKVLCNTANAKCLHPISLWCYEELAGKFEILESDYIGIVDENPYSAMVFGCVNWIPSSEYSTDDLNKALFRNAYKYRIWNSFSFNERMNKIKKMTAEEISKLGTWEELEKTINSLKKGV